MRWMKYLHPSVILLAVTYLTYGVLIQQLGFYWDDLPITWIRYQLGPAALTDYFSTNRPVWGLVHQLSTSLIPQVPAYWQVFALLWRWLGAVVVLALMFKLLPGRQGVGLGVALLFVVYPGFNQHWAAYLYGHFYVVLFFFLASLWCMLKAIEARERYWAWTTAGLFLSALNLWMMEYFYVLELARVGLILMMVRSEPLSWQARMMRVLRLWLPYLFVFGLAVISRLFIFNNQVYGISLTGQLKAAPLETLIALARSVLLSLRLVLKDAWLQVLELPGGMLGEAGVYYTVIICVALIGAAGLLMLAHTDNRNVRGAMLDGIWLIGVGGLAVLLAGGPFWLIGFTPSLQWPASRFTLPFILGMSLIYGGVVTMIPWRRAQIVVLVTLVSLAAGRQYLVARDYVHDWEVQKMLFWQMSWRVPGLQPDTLVLLNEGAFNYYADNSLAPVLNWIYAPDNHTRKVDFALFHPKTRLKNALPELQAGLPIYYDYLAGEFNGNTSQTLVVYYMPPGCLRILDNDVEQQNRTIPEQSLMRYAAGISNLSVVTREPLAQMPVIYGPEPEKDFCFYYEKADLARQFGDWDAVMQFSEMALAFDEHPYIPAERILFIEGYAHAGAWDKAVAFSKQAYEAAPDGMSRMLCRLWKRIGAETASGAERDAALHQIQALIDCQIP